ncbi:MAG: methionyl-tRNA formyltransferase [Schaalia hyovaginalis]|uniref:methionyl-tRNA formyltransferase n=1 Tax=Schaalia hyovaginalis TaxID=29316 RepID=UPI001EEE5096|nr:methionyl-tRNA formyltransferase [Schaalia hyovaginalis]MCF2710188.1 methionyl-tRNA formyltransferase [Schaalia hyovaginalis]MCI7672072.1 methionyl-tRNA formyltransferase [Schaalia hyovaginalis]MDY5506537.1 methionyl-tRNA formyltransferase [Schaalia hyovaginalis]MDY5602060.1 methionyl-tRNA formyltransferase [Schaalia hyovaginalis]MDY6213315.1 methionyl-tRNA formyltransferase [Schaalia hyovaginalis]
MRIVFAGTPAPAVPVLRGLIGSDHEVVAVLTRPPARKGRGRALSPSPVGELAAEAGLEVIEASNFKDAEIRDRVRRLGADLGVVVAYGALIPAEVLEMPAHGWINLHFSDLPQYRGAAPVQWAILRGETRTASSVFQLEAGLDSGPVFSRLPVDIGHETAGQLLDRMAELGVGQVLEVVDAIEAGSAVAVPQDEGEGLIRARRLSVQDGFIDFLSSAAEVDRRIRALSPNPGAWTVLPDGKRLKLGAVTVSDEDGPEPGIVEAAKRCVRVGCGIGSVELGRVAPAGKGWMEASAWARGARLAPGARLGRGEGS